MIAGTCETIVRTAGLIELTYVVTVEICGRTSATFAKIFVGQHTSDCELGSIVRFAARNESSATELPRAE